MNQSNSSGFDVVAAVVPNAMGEHQVLLTLPAPGQIEHITIPNGYDIVFKFDYGNASFSRSGYNLLISSPEACSVCIHDFFTVPIEGAKLPDMVFEDGSKVNLGAFLNALGVDVATAAGPVAPASTGVGTYSAEAGELLAGVDTLESLAGMGQNSMGNAPTTRVQNASVPGAGSTGESPSDGAQAVAPKIPYHGRAVLYTKDYYSQGDASSRPADPSEYKLVIDLSKADSSSALSLGADQAQAHFLSDGNGKQYFAIESINAGKIVLHLTPAGLEALGAGKNVYDYLQITAYGQSHTIQLVGAADNSFDSHMLSGDSQHNGQLSGNQLIHGEWHGGRGLEAVSGKVNIIDTSGRGDTFVLDDGMKASGAGSLNQINTHTAYGKAATIATTGWSVHHGGMFAEEKGQNIIDGSFGISGSNSSVQGVTNIHLQSDHGMHAKADGANIIQNIGGSINLVAGGGAGMNVYNGYNTIDNVNGHVVISGGANSFATWDGGRNTVSNVHGAGGVQATGRVLAEHGENIIEHIKHSVTISGTPTAGGLVAMEDGSNTIRNIGGNVVISTERPAQNSLDSNTGYNSISNVTGNMEINSAGSAIYTVLGNNTISGVSGTKGVTVNAKEGMWAGDGTNEISQVTGSVAFHTETAGMTAAQGGSNTIAGVGGNVQLNSSTAMWAYGGGRNSVSDIDGEVIYTTERNGLDVSSGSTNSIADVGGVTIASAEHAMSAFGGLNIIHNAGDISLTGSITMQADNAGHNLITGGHGNKVQVFADGSQTNNTIAMHSFDSSGNNASGRLSVNEITALGGQHLAQIELNASGYNGGVGYGLAAYGGVNKLSQADHVTLVVNREADGRTSSAGGGFGLFATGGANVVERVTDVTVNVSSDFSAIGLASTVDNTTVEFENKIMAEGTVHMDIAGGKGALGMQASFGGANLVLGKEAVHITAAGQTAKAMVATDNSNKVPGKYSLNSLGTAENLVGDVSLKAQTTEQGKEAMAMHARDGASNQIHSSGLVYLEASGASEVVFAVHADKLYGKLNAGNHISTTAGDRDGKAAIDILADDQTVRSGYVNHGMAVGVVSITGTKNTFNAAHGSVDIRATSTGGQVSSIIAEGGQNEITAQNVRMQAVTHAQNEGVGYQFYSAAGMRAYNNGHNTVTVANEFSIEAHTGSQKDIAVGMLGLPTGGTNTVQASADSSGIEVRIVAEAGAASKAYAMLANGAGVANRIIGANHTDGHDYISLKGAISTSNGGVNLINTGAGNDIIVLDGKVFAGALTLEAGSGYDILTLKAGNIAEFTARYQGWLNSVNVHDMGIEEVRVTIGYDSSFNEHLDLGAKLSWLESKFQDKVVYDLQMHGDFGNTDSSHVLSTGAGDDTVQIDGTLHDHVNLGTGNDWAILGGMGIGASLDGGAGNDTLLLNLQNTGDLAAKFHIDDVQNMDNLWLNLGNEQADTIDDAFLGKAFQVLNGLNAVHLLLDKDDVISLGATWEKIDADPYIVKDHTGASLTFDTYQYDNGQEVLTLYLQNLVG